MFADRGPPGGVISETSLISKSVTDCTGSLAYKSDRNVGYIANINEKVRLLTSIQHADGMTLAVVECRHINYQ